MCEGSVFLRADGKWCAKYKDARGKCRYLYRMSKAEAKEVLRQALKDRDEGIIPPSKMTVTNLLDDCCRPGESTRKDRGAQAAAN
jgi:hypothetical protein